MTAIIRPPVIHARPPMVYRPVARIELAREIFDLRVEALLWLFAAMVVSYLGFHISALDHAPPDLSFYPVWAVCGAIACFCLLEAQSSWREIASTRARD
jgi:hypothetical protein